MRLLYATSITLPSPLANRIQIVSMANAFGRILRDSFLLGLSRNGHLGKSNATGLVFNYKEMGSAQKSYRLAWRYIRLARQGGYTHIYCREEKLLFFMLLYSLLHIRRPKFIYEIHYLVYMKKWWFRLLLHGAGKIVSITSGMKHVLERKGYAAGRILVSPDAVDAKLFDISVSAEEARQKLTLPSGKKIILYAGSLEPWKGVGTLYECAKSFDDSYLFLIVGGRKSHVDEFNGLFPPRNNFVLVGHKAHDDIPLYLKAADVLVLPNSDLDETSRISTSPMKLFEYMASKRPIAASRLPSTEEILTVADASGRETELATYFRPDDPRSTEKALRDILDTKKGSQEALVRAEAAYKNVISNTWDRRAKNILDFISL